jgi:hypothetical protein
MRNRTSPSLTDVFAATGTSTTSPATDGTICTELRTTAVGPEGAPHPIGMNSPTIRASSTMAGDSFQNVLSGMNRSQTNSASRAI